MTNPTLPEQPQTPTPQLESESTPQSVPQPPDLTPPAASEPASEPVPQSAPQAEEPASQPTPESAPQSVPAPQGLTPQAASEPAPEPVPQSAPQPAPQVAPQPPETVKVVTRFVLLQRIEHIVLLFSFSLLALTGLPQKFSSAPLSQFVINLFGGIESIRVVHRVSAVVLMTLSIYHVVAVLYRIFVQRVPWTMLPVVEDFKHLWHDLLFYFGRRKHKAYYGRYNYAEKAEYLAVVWGTLIMILTGFMMWNPIATTSFLPGQVIPAAKVAHGGEAVLAVLAIILWHFYHVHLRHLNKSMFTGKMTRHEMEEEHPAELALIEADKNHKVPPPAVLRRRQKIFYPIASAIVIVSGILLVGFVSFEKTAIETVPIEVTGAAFVPYTPTPTINPPTLTPTPTLAPNAGTAAGPAWDTTISALFNAKCAVCHINTATNDLSLKTYADALKGGKSGPAVVPNAPDQSLLVQVQQKGGHPGQLSADELAQVIAWINAGAPETASGAGPAPVATPIAIKAVNSWADAEAIFTAKCTMCHIDSQAGNLSLKTYTDTLKGGNRGPAIVPGDRDKSVLVTFQQSTSHPSLGRLTPEELAPLIAWIQKGAPENASAEPAASETPPATEVTPTSEAPTASGTPSSGGSEAWAGGIDQLLNAKCAGCHVNAAMGNLSLKTYADALKGGKDGPVIVPNDPDKSLLVQIQQKGGHPGQLTPDELNRVIAWIKAGAPEQGGGPAEPGVATPSPTTPTSTTSQWSDFAAEFNAKCGACHIQSQSGGLSLKTYADALKGGKDGPAIVPNDPGQSLLVQIQQKGGHPGQLTPEEIDRIVKWIEAGATETAGTTGSTPVVTTTATSAVKTWADAYTIFAAKCTACHINSQAGNLSLKTYADALKGGQSGPAIVPNDPDKSVLVKTQQGTSHPSIGMLTPEELAAIIAWIKAGAPEK